MSRKRLPSDIFLLNLINIVAAIWLPEIDKNKFKFGKRFFRILSIYPNLKLLR